MAENVAEKQLFEQNTEKLTEVTMEENLTAESIVSVVEKPSKNVNEVAVEANLENTTIDDSNAQNIAENVESRIETNETVIENTVENAALEDCSMETTEIVASATETNEIVVIENETEAQKPNDGKQQKAPPLGSLGLLSQYSSSSDEDEDSSSSGESDSDSESDSSSSDDDSVVEVPTTTNADTNMDSMARNILDKVMENANYRDAPDDSSETESNGSDIECLGNMPTPTVDITNEEEFRAFMENCDDETPNTEPIKAKGELGIEDLPPIEELTITVPESECKQLGTISGIVDTMVLVESIPNFAAVDIDTVLFLDKGNRTLGQVFDLMGHVSSPIYCVRFNKAQDIIDKDIKTGLLVYVAPQTEYTNFIVLSNLMNQKGCDASWENDHEPPDGCDEFSDDEDEKLARRARNEQQRNRNRTTSEQSVPSKVRVKTENQSQQNNRNKNRRQQTFNRNNVKKEHQRQPTQFYKDNRGYANAAPHYANYYPPQAMQQPAHYDHSWHTAALHGALAPPPPQMIGAHPSQQMYPNPFAMQQNQFTLNPFNLQAFPPLPPPLTMPPLQNHPNTNRPQQFQQQQQQQSKFNYNAHKKSN